MNPLLVLGALAADWDRLGPRLTPGARRELTVLLRGVRAAESGWAAGGEPVGERAVRSVLGGLPDAEAARLLRTAGDARYADAAPLPHHGYDHADLCMLVLDGNPMVGPVFGPVRRRLLAAPALSRAEVLRQGGDPGDRRLITLSDAHGRRVLPAFQFEAGPLPWRVVLEVNALLGAGTDPWGAADWWLSGHAWWDAAPAGLLGRGRDEELRQAARALCGPDEGD
ncbi:hypothetical protein [Streptomyces sp. JJ36]|uniref:hypothetical protein n=1 Tax=Streptomyces sp. JJ36 TaxID=2736645 RepID=UPI001F215012|nr:hypothetical protein [Streptomyces sp. JJ36]MCF6523836.1 hypothetical protein [Streptomyces sp. JJ36]